MIRIGITGSFASGKSELLKYLISMGYPGFNCDRAVHELHASTDVQSRILAIFPEIKEFNKAEIAAHAYADNAKLKKLEELLHPLVAKKMQSFLDENSRSEIAFLEIPLLFEAKWEEYCDYIISLFCTRELRMERAHIRGVNAEMFELIDKSQLPENVKKDLADFTIDTACDFAQVAAECQKIIKFII